VIMWPADDPRLEGVADRLAAQFDQEPDEAWTQEALPDDLARLLDSVFLTSVPCAPRLLALLERRGYTGWTNIRRTRPQD
jgi:hypothetical protein